MYHECTFQFTDDCHSFDWQMCVKLSGIFKSVSSQKYLHATLLNVV